MKDTNQVETISISDGEKVYEFEKPKFNCELLKVVKSNNQTSNHIVGLLKFENCIYTCQWTMTGNIWDYCESIKTLAHEYYLTPVQQKKEWHEDKANSPALLVKGQCPSRPEFPNEVTLCWSGEYFKNNLKKAGWRLATKAERDSFFCLDIDAISSKETN